jgi:hypothetical protein
MNIKVYQNIQKEALDLFMQAQKYGGLTDDMFSKFSELGEEWWRQSKADGSSRGVAEMTNEIMDEILKVSSPDDSLVGSVFNAIICGF